MTKKKIGIKPISDNMVTLSTTRLFKNPFNAHRFPKEYESNSGELITIPDQSMSITEIVRRFQKGIPLGGARVEFYEGEDDVLEGVNFNTLDISERYAILEDRKNELVSLQRKYDQMAKDQEREYWQQKGRKDQEKDQVKKDQVKQSKDETTE